MTTLHLRKSIGPATVGLGLPRVQPIWIIRGFLLIPLAVASFALSPTARAQLSPAPDGGYPNLNTAEGEDALFSLTTGDGNTAIGWEALYKNTGGILNTATGAAALNSNTTGSANTAEGYHALFNNTGADNIGLGVNAGLNLTTGSHNIDIGNSGVAAESATIRIGAAAQTRAFIAGVRGVTTANANAVPVVIDSAGQLGTVSSSKRFKKEIKPMDQTSEAILGLKPVTFHYKSDPAGAGPQFGLIAEEVAQVNPDLVVRDEKARSRPCAMKRSTRCC